jgi:hypothetical protein
MYDAVGIEYAFLALIGGNVGPKMVWSMRMYSDMVIAKISVSYCKQPRM